MGWALRALVMVGSDMKVYSGQRFQAYLPAGVRNFPPLDLMSPPLELAPLTLEITPLETLHPSSAWLPLEVVVLGVCKFLVSGVCKLCTVFSDL